MMLGRSRGIRGLGSTCVMFNLGDIQSYFGGGSEGVPFNLITVQQETSGRGGCMPDYAVALMPQEYIDGHSIGTATPAVDRTYTGVTAGATLLANPAPVPTVTALTVNSSGTPISTATVPLANTAIQSAPSPSGILTPGLPPAAGAPAASAIPSTIFGINSMYVIGGVLAAFLFLGGKK